MNISKRRILTRLLTIALGIPVGVLLLVIALGFISMLLQHLNVHLSMSDILWTYVFLIPAILFGFLKHWTGSRKTGNNIFKFGAGVLIVYLLIATVFSTINTNRLVQAGDRVKVPAGFDRVVAENSVNYDDLLPDALLPCIDLQADGCPSMHRTWKGEKNQSLSRIDLENIIKDNGLENQLAIREESCREDESIPMHRRACWAYGTIDGFETYIAIQNSHASSTVTLSMREPRGVPAP